MKLGLVGRTSPTRCLKAELIQVHLLPGFTTADAVGGQAGRGVGMDVVKRVIETMNGHIEVGRVRAGHRIYDASAAHLAHCPALLVRVGSERYAIPLPSVRRSHDVRQLKRATDGRSFGATNR